MSWVVDPPGTKGGPQAGNFPGPPKNTFCPGWSHDPGQKALLSRVVASPGTKGSSVPGRGSTRDKRLPPLYLPSSSPLPQHLVVFLICVVPPSSPAPTAPPACRRRRPRAPPTSAARAPPPHHAVGAELRRPRASSTSPIPSQSAAPRVYYHVFIIYICHS